MRPVVGALVMLMYDGALICPGTGPIACISRSMLKPWLKNKRTVRH